jgi:hypothetical protein
MQLGFSAFKLSARCGGTLRQRERESRDRGRKRERDRERERERERERLVCLARVQMCTDDA